MTSIKLSIEVTTRRAKLASILLREQSEILYGIRKKFDMSSVDNIALLDVASIMEGLAQDAERKEGTRK